MKPSQSGLFPEKNFHALLHQVQRGKHIRCSGCIEAKNNLQLDQQSCFPRIFIPCGGGFSNRRRVLGIGVTVIWPSELWAGRAAAVEASFCHFTSQQMRLT